MNPGHLASVAQRAREGPSLAAVEAQFLAVGQYGALEPDDLLAVGELIADARDHVAGLHCRLGPAVGLHPFEGGATDQPFLLLAVIGLNLKGHHRVRICPRELDYRALDPISWTLSEGRIRCPEWDQAKQEDARDDSSPRSSWPVPSGWSWMRARRSAPSPAS